MIPDNLGSKEKLNRSSSNMQISPNLLPNELLLASNLSDQREALN